MPIVPPRQLDPDVEDQLFARLAAGETLRRICRDRGMPSREVVYANREAFPEFDKRYIAARMMGNDAIAEDILDITDATPARSSKGNIDNGYVAWQRLRMDARLKLLPHWDRRYADKMDLGNREGETLKADVGIDSAALTVSIAKAMRAAKLAEGD